MTTPKESRALPHRRQQYAYFQPISTRWMDNDVYGHVNNVVYFSFFDTVINRYLIEHGGLDIHHSDTIGLCVESHCAYAKPIAFPDDVEAGMRVLHLGRSSVKYEIGIFARGEEDAAAQGHFVHVFVERTTRASTPIPETLRIALAKLAPT